MAIHNCQDEGSPFENEPSQTLSGLARGSGVGGCLTEPPSIDRYPL